MFKSLLFQLHWLLGITAGTVLAVMGLTGATLAFEDEIMRAANPAFAHVAAQHDAGAQPLELTTLVPMLQQGQARAMQRLRVDATGKRLSVARFAGGQEHWRYFDPYTGAPLDDLRGLGFFAFVEDLHRHLVSGERGSLVTGSCAIALVFFCLSGLYLRWPRRWWHWRTWLAVEWARTGRSFLWSLHSVVGTWVLLVYLMIALTGLWWSFDWYRSGVTRLLGGTDTGQRVAPVGRGALDLAKVQATLYALDGVRGGYIDLRFPAKPGAPLTARVQGDNAAHDRAQDLVQLDPASGALLDYAPYAGQDAGGKAMVSVFALHSGSFFGLPGRIVVMLSSLCMLVFSITGWMLYLDRRRKNREVRASRLPVAAVPGDGQAWLVAFASQSGFAEQLAWRAAAHLQSAGVTVQVRPFGQLDDAALQQARSALFVISTFGDGEAPDAARAAERRLLTRSLPLAELDYALLGLGDRGYARFCGFPRSVDAWLQAQGARRLFAPVEVDREDPQALARWQQQLAAISGIDDHAPLPLQPALQAWTLHARRLLNPGSAAGAIWQVALRPPPHTHWQAGDILEVAPRHDAAHVRAVLARHGLDPAQPIALDGTAMTLAEAAAGRELPDTATPVADATAWVSGLPQLPHRDYSIASVPGDDHLQLVVRVTSLPDGRHGLGSGWLCVHADTGGAVLARVRRNAGFHRHPEHAPMLLIGNGTGIAGLRSLLREAAAQGDRGHWLVFGERTRAHDHLYRDEIAAWQQDGHLARVDLAFSRDADGGGYVQHRLRDAAQAVQAWVAMGGSVYVCGSLHGMAEGVDAVLREVLGEDTVDGLLDDGRYRRDVY
jgi:sulfite reductase (NADPH) flavoprotein alpha-component